MNKFLTAGVPVGRPSEKLGYFEITYAVSHGVHRSLCLMAMGFQDAKVRFEAHGLGDFLSMKEVPFVAYLQWFNALLTRTFEGGR